MMISYMSLINDFKQVFELSNGFSLEELNSSYEAKTKELENNTHTDTEKKLLRQIYTDLYNRAYDDFQYRERQRSYYDLSLFDLHRSFSFYDHNYNMLRSIDNLNNYAKRYDTLFDEHLKRLENQNSLFTESNNKPSSNHISKQTYVKKVYNKDGTINVSETVDEVINGVKTSNKKEYVVKQDNSIEDKSSESNPETNPETNPNPILK